MSKFTSCATISNSLPDGLKEKILKGNLKAVIDYKSDLQKVRADIEAKYTAAKKAHNVEAIKTTASYSYVNRPTDPSNELNQFATTGLKGILNNLVQRYNTIKDIIKAAIAGDVDINEHQQSVLTDFSKDKGFGQQFNRTLERIFKTTEFTQFRFTDPIQYLPQRDPADMNKILPVTYPNTTATSKFDTLIRTAMAATAYEWIHTDSIMATGQTHTSMRLTFGLSKDKPIPPAMFKQLEDIGINREYLANKLGRVILERINIAPTNKSDVGAKDRLILSLGLQTIAVMENMKFSDGTPMVKRQEVYIGKIQYEYGQASGFGLAALKEGVAITDSADVLYDPSPEQRAKDNDPNDKYNTGKAGKPTTVYIKLNTNQSATHELHTDLIVGKTLLNKAADTFDTVFGTEVADKIVSWKRIILRDKAKIDDFGTASESQTKNLQKSVDVAHVKSLATADTFSAITGPARDIIVGVVNMTSKLLIREKSVAGTNRSIARDIRMYEDFLEQETIHGSEFFLDAKFQANHRMRQQGMSLQNSKIIRNLFSAKSWYVSFNPKTDKELNDAFLQAIALSFDIETLKVGGKKNQLKKFKEKLKNPEIKAALEVLRKFHSPTNTNKVMTEEEQMTVALGVKETETKVHGLKGLVEYARYLNHTDGDFTTDIYNEMDGVSNGPIIGMLMLIRDTDSIEEKQALLAALAMGGISVDSRKKLPNLDELMAQSNLNDAYQRMGQVWAETEANMKLEARKESSRLYGIYSRYDNKLQEKQRAGQKLTKEEIKQREEYYQQAEAATKHSNQLMALEVLLGRFTENKNEAGEMVNDGIINKLIRKLSKPRTMQTVYGALITTQNSILAGENVIDEGIYDAIEKVIKDHKAGVASDIVRNQLAKILENTATLTGDLVGLDINSYYENGVLQIEKLQGSKNPDGTVKHKGFQLTTKQINAITKATRNTYGEAMKQAIDQVYAPIIAARKPFKTMNQRAASVYNLILQAKWNAAIAEKNALLMAEHKTKEEMFKQQKNAISQNAAKNKRKTTLEERQQIRELDESILSLAQELNRLTVEEATKITDSIKHLIPKIKTPMGSYLYLASIGASNNEDKINSKDYSKGATVEQAYANGTPLAKEYVDVIPYLKDLSVSGGMVRAIQMIDATIANHMMGIEGVDLLNVHDATIHSIKDIAKINYEANNIFKEIMFGSDTKPAYSIGQEIVNMHEEMTAGNKSLADVLTENGVKPEDQIKLFLADNVINPDTYGYPEESMAEEIEALREDAKKNKQYLSYKDALAQVFHEKIGLTDNMSVEEQQAFLDKLHNLIETNAFTMAEQVTRNKEELGESITDVAQFPNNGEGNKYVAKNKKTTVLGVKRNAVLNVDGMHVNESRQRLNDLWEQHGISGSSTLEVSIDEADYNAPDLAATRIDSQNVTEVFDSILTLDEQAAAASVPVSESHKADLRRILNTIVSTVMKPAEFFMAQYNAQNAETSGLYTPHNNTIWIQRQQVGQSTAGMLGQGIRMSAAVVYAHELIHHITEFGFKTNSYLANQMYDLYEFTRDSLKATYGDNAFKVFMNNAPTDPVALDLYLNDPANAREITAAKDRWEYVFQPDQRSDLTHDGLKEFAAFGMTDENFKRELSTLAISPTLLAKRKKLTTILEKNIQTTLVNIYTMMLDFIQHLFQGQTHSPMVTQEIENLVTALAKVDAKNKNTLLSAAAAVEEKASLFGLEMDEKVKTVANKAMNKFQLGRVITQLRKVPEANNMLSHRMRVAMLWYKDQEQSFIPALYTEMKGTTERLRALHSLQAKRNLIIDMAKQEAAKTMAAVNRDWFNRELTSQEKTAITKVLLKGDISLLQDYATMDAIKGFVESKTKREAHIIALFDKLQTQLNSAVKSKAQRTQYMEFFKGGIKDLAYGMITGEQFVEGVNYRNAHNLAMMDKTKYHGLLAQTDAFPEIVKLLDQLASVSSINYVKHTDRMAIIDLMNSNPDAINNVLLNHRKLQEDALAELFHGNPALMEKGYVKTILNSRIQFELGTAADEQMYADRGFVKHHYPFKRDTGVDPIHDDIYMYVSMNGTVNDLQSGTFSTTRNKTKGANSYDIQRQLGNQINPGFIADANNQLALTALQTKVDNMFRSSARNYSQSGENFMTPSFNLKGEMATLRYIMSEHTKDTVLQQFSEFDSVLGSMASQKVDKLNTPVINSEVVTALREMWDSEKTKYPEAYVKIGANSPIKRYRDLYNNLPIKTKDQILSEWGENGMWVSQDVVDLVFGQRKYSIVEMFDKNPLERNIFERLTIEGLTFALSFYNPFVKKQLDSPKGRAVTRAKTIEDFLIQATKLAKGNIIVRNIKVTWGNHISNVRYLKSKGIPLKTIVLLQREAITSALQYQADNDKLQVLLIKKRVIERDPNMNSITKGKEIDVLNRHIMRMQHTLALNPSTAMIQAGLLPSIVDDVDTVATATPHKFGLDKAIDVGLDKLPKPLSRIGRAVFMTEDTEGFKMLNNAVKMTDYVGRYVLYKHYTSKGMQHAEAVSRVSDEFINFAPPTHRMLEYANNIGVVWFSKYQLRVLKHIKNLVQEHPFSTLATFIIGSTTSNNNIINTIPFLTKDMSRMWGNPLSASVNSIDGILPISMLDTITGG